MATSKKLTQAQAMQALDQTKHFIDTADAAKMVKKFKSLRTKVNSAKKKGEPLPAFPTLPVCLTYNKAAIESLLAHPAAVGLRMYPAVNASDEFTLVLVAVNEAGENILEVAPSKKSAKSKMLAGDSEKTATVDEAQVNPPFPAIHNGF